MKYKNILEKVNLILIIITVVLIITLGICFIFFKKSSENENPKKYADCATLKGVIVRVFEKSLYIMDDEEGEYKCLYSIGFGEEGNIGFEKGQEVVVYYAGAIMESYPAQLGDVRKIEITKDKSDIEIPKTVLQFCYSSWGNVDVDVKELTNAGITLVITDTNEMHYEYSHSYSIGKEVPYTGNAVYHYYPGDGPIDEEAAALDRNKPKI